MFFLFSVLGLAIVSWSGRLRLGARDACYECHGAEPSPATFITPQAPQLSSSSPQLRAIKFFFSPILSH